ncbi:hypothetical protein ACFYV7_14820 [Nocardia suismassiliense]|uniref:HTH cro/C1-type domain-containing protein n=1 Tax=Nocardia suismassiliense TaxID=2077092 RepID=A0ABW6QS54_9NOCA
MIDPNEINTCAELSQALAELHRSDPRQRSFHDVAAAAEIAPATVFEMVKGDSFPRWRTLERALTAWGVAEAQLGLWRGAHERARGDNSSRLGRPLVEITNPFELEVHRSITLANTGELPCLPLYVRRAHDRVLAEIVQRAMGGESVMAVLVAGSSAGKTRSIWEALTPLREVSGWRLWHPLIPTRRHALDELKRVKARTVLWLNELQEYLGSDDEQIAVELHRLLPDKNRAPVLILGTLWPAHHARLCGNPASQIRKLLEHKVIALPEQFVGQDLIAVRQTAATDPRLAKAVEQAEDGQITQYLAGGPELVNWYLFSSSPTAKAVTEVAMDARRLGHRNAFSYALLRDVAPSYMSAVDWDQAGGNWLEQALAETSTPRKGARGPVTRIHSTARPTGGRRNSPQSQSGTHPTDTEPLYQLADYLDEYGRTHRADRIPPIRFWESIALHAHPDDLTALGIEAWKLHLNRDAAQLWKNATRHGAPYAPVYLLKYQHQLQPDDHRPADWIVDHADLNNPEAVDLLLETLSAAEEHAQISALLARDPATHVELGGQDAAINLLKTLHSLSASNQVAILADRIIAETRVPSGYCPSLRFGHCGFPAVRILQMLHDIGADRQMHEIAAQVVAHTEPPSAMDDRSAWSEEMVDLLEFLHNADAGNLKIELVERILAYFTRNDPDVGFYLDSEELDYLGRLLRALHRVGSDTTAVTVAEQLVSPLESEDVGELSGLADLLAAFEDIGAHDQAATLADRIHIAADNSALAAAERLDANVYANEWFRAVELLRTLRAVGAGGPAAQLAERIAEHLAYVNDDVRHPEAVARLLILLRQAGTDTAMTTFLTRDWAALVDLGDGFGVASMLTALHAVGAETLMEALTQRVLEHAPLDDPTYVRLLVGSIDAAATEDSALSAISQRIMGKSTPYQDPADTYWRNQSVFGREPNETAAEPWTWQDLTG